MRLWLGIGGSGHKSCMKGLVGRFLRMADRGTGAGGRWCRRMGGGIWAGDHCRWGKRGGLSSNR